MDNNVISFKLPLVSGSEHEMAVAVNIFICVIIFLYMVSFPPFRYILLVTFHLVCVLAAGAGTTITLSTGSYIDYLCLDVKSEKR